MTSGGGVGGKPSIGSELYFLKKRAKIESRNGNAPNINKNILKICILLPRIL
jgi:hypothetical protein